MSGRLLPEVLPRAAGPERIRDKPVLIVHGTSDGTLGVHHGRGAVRVLTERFPLSVDYLEFDMGHITSQESLAAVSGWLTAHLSD